MSTSEACPAFAPFFGFAGAASAMILSAVGAAYGTAKAGIGIAGIIAVYGLVVSVLVSNDLNPDGDYSLFAGFVHLAAGLSTGFAGLSGGYAIGVVGDACVRGYLYQPKMFVGMVLILIFAEVLGLYGLIVSLILNTKATSDCT
ncbi:hypothetical protein PhCBS80983_g03458 [Powellomyces hirtus]|uniref:V-type proton ATPase proteolipid subunit n=1 Tax=Powellomyces hirtus TaxID=109895 RepID=A0A507E293_9FUNG|nr:hypothetical protein PhCBS80983_g03458 [Powellomyces hirtus]